jgi:hypothetical protein
MSESSKDPVSSESEEERIQTKSVVAYREATQIA